MHSYLSHSLVALVGATLVFLTTSCTDSARGEASSASTPDPLPISTWKLPTTLSFCGEAVPLDIPEVRERAEREFYLNLQSPGQLILYIKRSARYFPTFERELKSAGAPDDLKYLSVAESALFMVRSAKDAVGLWQFIPATGRAYGLVINDNVDERRNILKSTRAAIAYLKSGRAANGSWANAAAGYNMGHENFRGSKDYQQAREFWDLYLNEETSRYLLRIAVIKHIMEHATEYGIVVPERDRYHPSATRSVVVDDAVSDIAAWARTKNATYKDVKILNPWILGRSLPAPSSASGWTIELPA